MSSGMLSKDGCRGLGPVWAGHIFPLPVLPIRLYAIVCSRRNIKVLAGRAQALLWSPYLLEVAPHMATVLLCTVLNATTVYEAVDLPGRIFDRQDMTSGP